MTAPVTIAPGLDSLPLLDLAEDLVRLRFRKLTVATEALPREFGGGVCAWWPDGDAVVVLDPATIAPPCTVDLAWAHELGHLLDLLDGRVSGGDVLSHSRDARGCTERAEAFACRIAPMLLEHAPTTVAETRSLITAARRRTVA